jgi:hypothetical protein
MEKKTKPTTVKAEKKENKKPLFEVIALNADQHMTRVHLASSTGFQFYNHSTNRPL